MNNLLWIRRLLNYLNLESELDDPERIHATIEKDIIFKGTNLWILSFAIIVASVGLNMNSTAVIIGAMLISPLMGPINGIGYSIATYNMPLFRKAIKNLGFAIIAGLVASTAYFAITPISTAHSELLARTSPTIYDVLIALFGGLAGIVAITSKQKGNVIPGVAIATALMPPLCTSGYGLATGQLSFFFGAFYLFTINTVFIAIASLIITQVLRLPIRGSLDPQVKKRINQWISVVIAIVLIPSIYFGYLLVQKERFIENANLYVQNISIIEGNFLLRNEINAEERRIRLVYGGPTLDAEQQRLIRDKATDFGLKDVEITFQQGLSFDEVSRSELLVDDLKEEITLLQMQVDYQNRLIDSLQKQKAEGGQILSELRSLYTGIQACTYASADEFHGSDGAVRPRDIVILTLDPAAAEAIDRERLRRWLRSRLQSDRLQVYFKEE